MDIRNNESESQFEASVDGHTAVAAYDREDGRVTFTHTAVPEQLEGRGIASALVKKALDWARAEKLRVTPQCSYVKTWIERHPDYDDLVDG